MRFRSVLVVALVVVTIAFFARQFSTGLATLDTDALPSSARLVVAVVLLVVGQVLLGEGLVAVAPQPATARQARVAFHSTQPMKYVPVGIAQAASLTVILRRSGARSGHAAAAWMIDAGAVVLAGVVVGLAVGVVRGWPLWFLPFAVLPVLVMWRPALAAVLEQLARVVPLVSILGELPSQVALWRCLAASGAGLALHGVAFAVLVSHLGPSVAASISAYALAQGLATATPLPGGLGVREALLLGFLSADESSVLTSVVLVRLLLMGVEAALWGWSALGVSARTT